MVKSLLTLNDYEFMSLEDLDATLDEDLPEQDALAYLLLDGVCFINQRHYAFKQDCASEGQTTVVFVLTNDVFAWGCADGDDLPTSEIVPLYRLWRQDNVYGPVKWACRRRQCQPQQALIDAMKQHGAWDDELALLPANPFNQPRQAD